MFKIKLKISLFKICLVGTFYMFRTIVLLEHVRLPTWPILKRKNVYFIYTIPPLTGPEQYLMEEGKNARQLDEALAL